MLYFLDILQKIAFLVLLVLFATLILMLAIDSLNIERLIVEVRSSSSDASSNSGLFVGTPN